MRLVWPSGAGAERPAALVRAQGEPASTARLGLLDGIRDRIQRDASALRLCRLEPHDARDLVGESEPLAHQRRQVISVPVSRPECGVSPGGELRVAPDWLRRSDQQHTRLRHLALARRREHGRRRKQDHARRPAVSNLGGDAVSGGARQVGAAPSARPAATAAVTYREKPHGVVHVDDKRRSIDLRPEIRLIWAIQKKPRGNASAPSASVSSPGYGSRRSVGVSATPHCRQRNSNTSEPAAVVGLPGLADRADFFFLTIYFYPCVPAVASCRRTRANYVRSQVCARARRPLVQPAVAVSTAALDRPPGSRLTSPVSQRWPSVPLPSRASQRGLRSPL